jgi:hypothetical protein
MQLSARGQRTPQRRERTWLYLRERWRLPGTNPANSPNICECDAVAYVLDMRVTAQVSLTDVRRLQPRVSRLQRRHGRFVGVQTPHSTDSAPDKS